MSNVIAVVFDFDDTLAPDSTTGFLNSMGVDTDHFWKNEVDPMLKQDWDPVPAYLYQMIEYSRLGKTHAPITQQALSAWGRALPLNPGVEGFFDHLRTDLKRSFPHIQLEYYLISSGIGDVLRHTSIAHHFTDIWASEFSYDTQGHIVFPKKIVSFTDKTRYLFHIQKGLIGPSMRSKPFEVNRKVPSDRLRVPFDQMIFVGDGYTDIPCFSMLMKAKGIAFGVFDPAHRDKHSRAWGFIEDGRVSNLNHARYNPEAELYGLLEMAVRNIAGKLTLSGHSYRG